MAQDPTKGMTSHAELDNAPGDAAAGRAVSGSPSVPELEMLLSVTSAVNRAATVSGAFQQAVDIICGYLNWPVGHAYAVLPAAEGRFRELDVWSARARRENPELVGAWRSVHPRPGEGLLGGIEIPRTAVWREVSDLPGLLRRRGDASASPKSAIIVPVRTDDNIVAVAEFYAFGMGQPTDGVLTALTQAGIELGHIVERQQGQFRGLRRQQGLERVARLALVGEMAGGIAHQLNQPLAAIMNYVAVGRRMMLNHRLDRERLVEIGTQIEAQVRRAAEVVEQVRGFAQRQPPKAEPLDVGEVIDIAVGLTGPVMRAAGAEAQVRRVGRLPRVLIDRRQFEHVIINLLMNAAEATEDLDPENRVIEIRMLTTAAGGVRISVSNRSRGLTETVLAHLFEPFFSTKPGGTGMGLPISRSIVEAYGGHLRIEPSAESFTVHVELPAGESD